MGSMLRIHDLGGVLRCGGRINKTLEAEEKRGHHSIVLLANTLSNQLIHTGLTVPWPG